MTDNLRVALVGYGMAGRDIHGPLLRSTPGVQITHVITSDPERSAAAARDFPAASVLPALDALWPALAASGAGVDLVVIASATRAHVEQATAAALRGVAVVVDKPLATGADEARRLVDLAAARGVPLTVFQNRRWDSDHLTARRLIAEGALGAVFRYEARYERWRPEPKKRWREELSTELGGGLLLDLQVHLVDAAIHLFGPVNAVYAEVASLTTVSDDVTFLALHHRSGVRSHLSSTSLAGAPGPRMRILGRAGAYVVAATWGEPSAFEDLADRDGDHRGWLVRGADREPAARAPGGWSDFYPAVVAMITRGAPPPVDPRDAVAVLEVLDAARKSARENLYVDLLARGAP
jgi:predicted dehydrogenase